MASKSLEHRKAFTGHVVVSSGWVQESCILLVHLVPANWGKVIWWETLLMPFLDLKGKAADADFVADNRAAGGVLGGVSK